MTYQELTKLNKTQAEELLNTLNDAWMKTKDAQKHLEELGLDCEVVENASSVIYDKMSLVNRYLGNA